MLPFFRVFRSCRMFCSIAEGEGATLHFRYRIRPLKKRFALFLQEIFDCSFDEAYETITKHPSLIELSRKNIRKAANVLKEYQVKGEEIRESPLVLKKSPMTIEHYLLVLKESGFPKVTASHIVNFSIIVRRKISILKTHGILPEDANVSKNFLAVLKAPESVAQNVEAIIDINSDENTIFMLRDEILKCYLQWRLEASKDEIEHIYTTYTRLNNKSLQLMRRTISILLNELKFPKEHITRNGYIIQAHPDDLKKIMETVPYLGGKPIRDVLYAYPVMVNARYENFIEVLKAVKEAGIPDEYIIRAGGIFTLSGQLVKERLPTLYSEKMAPEVKDFMIDDKILRVLLHYETFLQRTTYLRKQYQSSSLPSVPSINCLISSNENFEKFVKGISGPNQGRDVVNYLVRAFKSFAHSDLNVTVADVRALLGKNPNWRHVPLSEVRACLEMLRKRGYKPKEILSSLPIVLYSPSVVKYHLERLSSQPQVMECFELDYILGNDFLSKGRNKSASEAKKCNLISEKKKAVLIRNHTLSLCMYFLERDYHFSGDGVWFRE